MVKANDIKTLSKNNAPTVGHTYAVQREYASLPQWAAKLTN